MKKYLLLVLIMIVPMSSYAYISVDLPLTQQKLKMNNIIDDNSGNRLSNSEIMLLNNLFQGPLDDAEYLDDLVNEVGYDDYFLFCTAKASIQLLSGIGGGNCLTFNINSEGEIVFKHVNLTSIKVGIGVGVSILSQGLIKFRGASSVDQIVGVFDRLTSSLAIAFEGELTWALKSLDQNIYGYVDINHGVGINVNLLSFERILINGVTPTRVVQLPLIE